MDFYENKEKIEKYINFTPSHDGTMLVDLLVDVLPSGSSVLELGIGPGKDFERLSKHFKVTGSDSSKEFLRLFREKNPDAELVNLDARTIEIDRTFDGIFSNKVLFHLSREELRQSLVRQYEVLNDTGMIVHSLWYGTGEDEFNGLKFNFYNEQDIEELLDGYFEILEIGRHAKMDEGDSVYFLARKKS